MQYRISTLIEHTLGLRTIAIKYLDSSTISVLPGSIHIYDGTSDNIYTLDSSISKLVGSLSVSTQYAIYVKPPIIGNIIDSSDITCTSTMPVENTSKLGYYHSSNIGQRCIGFIYSDSSSNIAGFNVDNKVQLFNNSIQQVFWAAGGNVKPTLDVTVITPFIGEHKIIGTCGMNYDATNVHTFVRTTGYSGNGSYLGYITSYSSGQSRALTIKCSVNNVITFLSSPSATWTLIFYVDGFIYPETL